MGKVKIDIYCYLTADILTKVLQKCSFTKHINFVQTSEFGCRGNRKAKFAKKYKSHLLKSHKEDDAETLQEYS